MNIIAYKQCTQRWLIARTMLIILAFASESNAEDQPTSSVGGGGGTTVNAPCDEGQALVGIHGRAGDWWDRVIGDCRLKRSDGANASGPGSSTTTIGSEDFYAGDVSPAALCPEGQVVSGISVADNGSYVSGLCIWCKTLGTNGLTTGTATRIELRERDVGDRWKPGGDCIGHGTQLNCPDNLPARGLFGKEGLYVDRLGLVCGTISVVVPKVSSLTLDRETVVGGGTVTGTVRLNIPALSSGTSVVVRPAATNVGVTVTPNPVVITGPAFASSFQVNTTPRATAYTVSVIGEADGVGRFDTLRIDPPSPTDISPNTVTGGTAINGVIQLNGTAPANFGVTVTHDNPDVVTTSSPLYANCSGTTCLFTANTRAVSSNKTVTFKSGNETQVITVLIPRVKELTLSETMVTPGTSVTATAILTGPVPPMTAGTGTGPTNVVFVRFASLNTAVATVGPLQSALGSSAEQPVSAGNPSAAACTEITASLNNSTRSAFLGVAASQSNDITLTFPSTTIAAGSVVTGTLTANFKGPINITRSNNGVTLSKTVVPVFANQPETFTVTAGGSSGCTMITASSGARRRSVMIVVYIDPSG